MQYSIIDNKQNGILGDVVKETLRSNSKVSIISAYFTIYAFNHLRKELKSVDEIRFLFTHNPFSNDNRLVPEYLSPSPDKIFGDQSELRLKNNLNLRRMAKECASWVKTKTKVRAANQIGVIGSKMIHMSTDSNDVVINTSNSDFNSAGLGYAPSNMLTMNHFINEKEATSQFLNYFNDSWNNPSLVEDIKTEIIDHLSRGYKDYSPQYIYFFTLYNIFKEYLDDLDEERIVKSKTGFKETEIWNKLYNFQQDGVLGAIDKIEKFGGCIIADSVGLGKTFEALAVIKYYELRNDRVLVLCPKKLRDNWTVYTINDKRNMLTSDRFNYDVLNHTDLTRDKGLSGEINLATINWGNYDLIVIDESHNFRNNNPRRETETRYSRLMNNIIKAGVRTKVLMLSATPVNNRMNDLKNQVAFITEGDDMAFEDQGIASIHEVMKRTQTQFNHWLKMAQGNKDVASLLETLDARYFRLLDLITIARSRKHIEKYYCTKEIGKFPERLRPKNIKSDIDIEGKYPKLKEVNKDIRRLNLSAYSPLKYVRADKQKEYSAKYDMTLKTGSIFKQIDREQSLIHLMRVNLLKRMESSIKAFALTLGKLLSHVDIFLNKIQNKSEFYDADLSIKGINIDDPQLEDFLIGNKIKVLLQDIDVVLWKQDLLEDHERLTKLLDSAKEITNERDAKLSDLQELITEKVENPINGNNKKVIIFTAFADTAMYLYENLSDWSATTLGLKSALVTGSGKNKTNMSSISGDINEILINFSPLSKERGKLYPNAVAEIDLLIATDCISEGQNLQDCDFLVNYDIHWNPVRIIQRFGRVDRLGSSNERIKLVNFWPNMELDEYINLEARVSGKMVLLDVSATGEENVIDAKKEMNDLDYRRKQLEQLQNNVVDLEEMHGSISITDLTYNDFKMELMEFLKTNREELEKTPRAVHAITKNNIKEIPAGVIFCLKHLHKSNDKHHSHNALEPYYLIFIDNNGKIVYNISQNKQILDCYQRLCNGRTEALKELVVEFENQTSKGKDMDAFTNLLEDAVNEIVGASQEKGAASLFSSGGTVNFNEEVRSLDDFEVISFLVVKNDI